MDGQLTFALLVALIGVALLFDFLNGLHDAANSIATVVSTRVLKPQYAVVWAAFFNFVAAFCFGTGVAKTVSEKLIDPRAVNVYVVLGGLAGAIAHKLGIELGHITLKTFSAGEVYCRLEESVRGADVFIVQPTCANPATGISVNDAIMELLVMIDAAVGASAHRVIAVTPWYAYSRQDRSDPGRHHRHCRHTDRRRADRARRGG